MPPKKRKKKKEVPIYNVGEQIRIPAKSDRDRMFAKIDTSGDGELSLGEAKEAITVRPARAFKHH